MNDFSNSVDHDFSQHVAIIWQHFLPYHKARIRRLSQRLIEAGHRLTAIEVASQESSYSFGITGKQGDWLCAFPGLNYNHLSAEEIVKRVSGILRDEQPNMVFAPATPFPEGMAAVTYRQESGCRTVMMDDAWEMTDKRGMLTTLVKRLIHRNIDGVFIPAPTHNAYYQHMGFPADRIVYGVDVVDNDVYSSCADAARTNADSVRASLGLPQRYLLFVGRLMPRKGLHILLEAYHRYRMRAGDSALSLVLIGDGALMDTVEQLAAKIGSVYCLGPRFGEELCSCYGLAQALIVPSAFDSWGLVVNEGLASGLPVIVSTGCGAAETLVEVGGNGWTYTYDDRDELAGLMAHVNGLTDEELRRMGKRSREIIAAWSLDRFADGVIEALNLPRRMPGGMLADMAAKLWKGRVRIN